MCAHVSKSGGGGWDWGKWWSISSIFTVCSVKQQVILAINMTYCCCLVEAWGAFIDE